MEQGQVVERAGFPGRVLEPSIGGQRGEETVARFGEPAPAQMNGTEAKLDERELLVAEAPVPRWLIARSGWWEASATSAHAPTRCYRAGSVATGDVAVEDVGRALDQVVERTGAAFIHAYDDPRVIAGQGTAALELIEEVPDLDLLVAPVGGGGLLSGTAIAAHGLRPAMEVVGALRGIKVGVRDPGVPLCPFPISITSPASA